MAEFKLKEITNFESLLDAIKETGSDYDIAQITEAYNFAKEAHSTHIRLSGEPYEAHILSVAYHVVSLHLDTTSVVAALLHDTIEKAGVDINAIDKKFGTDVAFIVDGLSHIRRATENKMPSDDSIDNFKNLIFSTTQDVRIMIIRILEKMDNILKIDRVPEEIQKKAANKIMKVYGPLAEYLGLGFFQRAMEDAAFKILDPANYNMIDSYIRKYFSDSSEIIEDFKSDIVEMLKEYNIDYKEVHGRRKGVWSAYKKLTKRYMRLGEELTEDKFKRLKDLFATRIILNSVEDCYLVLGLVHSRFDFLQEDFDDYIASPKENGYRSIQTIVSFNGNFFEVQIRTDEMHQYNEFGPASHIAYKMMGSKTPTTSFTWTQDLVKWKKGDKLSQEDFKINVFSNSVFVFTPKGLLIRLEKGATPLDFAFRVHTDIGERYNGAKVNGKMVSKEYQLQTGDVVEVVVGAKPSINESWLKIVKSPSVKIRIRKILANKKLPEKLN